MKHKHDVDFYWDGERGICRCTIKDGDNRFVGVAECNPLDMDMKSEKVGQEISYHRAIIDALKFQKKVVKTELKALHNYYYSMSHSPHFNPKSYEARMLYRQIKFHKDDIEEIDNMICEIRQFIRDYIDKKDAFYQHIRKARAKGKED